MVYVVALFILAQSSPEDLTHSTALLEQAKEAWKTYAHGAANFQGTYTVRSSSDGVYLPSAELHEVRRNGWNSLLISHVLDCKQDGTLGQRRPQAVRGRNSLYAFELSPSGNGWVLNDFERLIKVPAAQLPSWRPPLLSICPLVGLGSFPEAAEAPDFRLVFLRPEPSAGERCFVLKCERTRNGRVVTATLHLDGSNYWCVKAAEFEERTPSRPISSGRMLARYQIVDGLPTPLERRTELVFYRDGVETQETMLEEFDYAIPLKLLSEADFTLSAFGLPEPFGITWERPTPWWLYALISAGVLFVVAVLVSIWKRRLAARSAA
ncbi:MAG TPA: hypothetical protein PKC18_00890 [Lacipirellulaceae bacterium]|nr:hypothetical protein [Lacipirellulaceae bacterium]HMP04385.1 hypothetical protein [Gemmatales bacterium]